MLLENKTAVIYGGAGNIGTAVARAWVEAGARVYLAGRTASTLEKVAADVGATGTGVVDVLDESGVTAFVDRVVRESGSLDVSFNLASRGDVQGTPLIDMPAQDFLQPTIQGLTGAFHTARAAARQMSKQGFGVVLALNSGSAMGSPMMGGTGSVDGAIDALIRNLAHETGPSGVRVVGIWTAGLPETMSPANIAETLGSDELMSDEAFAGLIAHLDGLRMTKRSPRLAELAGTATFLASDHAGAITGTWINVTSGMFTG